MPTSQLDVVTLPDSGSDTITYTYDNAHRLTKVTNGASETMNYTLDAMGDVTPGPSRTAQAPPRRADRRHSMFSAIC
jgi:uncharacterized protein RhaS with RHS repeats